MEKEQAEFADSPMLKFSTYSAGLRQRCFLKVSEPEVHRCGEFDRNPVGIPKHRKVYLTVAPAQTLLRKTGKVYSPLRLRIAYTLTS